MASCGEQQQPAGGGGPQEELAAARKRAQPTGLSLLRGGGGTIPQCLGWGSTGARKYLRKQRKG